MCSLGKHAAGCQRPNNAEGKEGCCAHSVDVGIVALLLAPAAVADKVEALDQLDDAVARRHIAHDLKI